MENLIFLFSYVCFLQGICCNDGILSKFYQTGYKLRDTRIQLMNYSQDYYNFLEIKAFKYNRTTTAHNFTFNLKVNVKDKVEAVIQLKKFLSNEYRHFPIRFQVNFKKSIDTNAMGLHSLYDCGSFTDAYFYKDITYHTCNFVVDETRLPPLIPNGKYRVDATLTYLNAEMSLMHIFAEVYTPIPLPK